MDSSYWQSTSPEKRTTDIPLLHFSHRSGVPLFVLTIVWENRQRSALTIRREPSNIPTLLAGQQITFTYIVQNVGEVPLCFPLDIYDSLLGAQSLGLAYLDCGEAGNVRVTRQYLVSAEDAERQSISSVLGAGVKIRENFFLVTGKQVSTLTVGSSYLILSMTAVCLASFGQGQYTVVITNSSRSTTAARDVEVTVERPPGVFPRRSPAIRQSRLLAGESVTFTVPFEYTGPAGTTYDFLATISSASHNGYQQRSTAQAALVPHMQVLGPSI